MIKYLWTKTKSQKGRSPMNRVMEIGKKGNRKSRQAVLKMAEEVNGRVEMIQALIPLGLKAVEEALCEEVERLAGNRYSRYGGEPGNVRWAKQNSFVYLGDCKAPIRAPRVRNRIRNEEDSRFVRDLR